MSETILKCVASWKEKLPDYEIKQWDETNTPFEKLPFLNSLYKNRKWSFISDYVRFYALYVEGGIYFDTDIEILKSFDSLLTEEAFIGFQHHTKEPLSIATGVIGSKVHGIFAYDALIETERKQRLRFNSMGGPPVATKILIKYGLSEYKTQTVNNVKILTNEYFSPFLWTETFHESCIKEETFCIHWWEGSWSKKERGVAYLKKSLSRKLQKLPSMIKDHLIYFFNRKNFFLTNKILKL